MNTTYTNHNFLRIAAAIPQLRVADSRYNAEQIENLMHKAADEAVKIVCFPELCITGYTCEDLFHQELLLDEAKESFLQLVERTAPLDIIAIVGLPLRVGDTLYNVAAVFGHNRILGFVPKTYLPNYNEFYERRWFSGADNLRLNEVEIRGERVPLGTQLLFQSEKVKCAIEVCEDLWVPVPPSSLHALAGANVIFNLSASNELIAKDDYRRQLIRQQSARCISGYVYASCGFGESTTDVVFAGNGYIAENGAILASSERFLFSGQLVISDIDVERLINERQKTTSFSYNAHSFVNPQEYKTIKFDMPINRSEKFSRTIAPHPFVPSSGEILEERCREIFNIQVSGLATRLKHTGIKTVTLGISGGLDSTLALLVCVRVFDKLGIPRSGIVGITMPGFGTTDQTYNNAIDLMRHLGVTTREISIREACIQHFKDIDHPEDLFNVTFENAQARERTQILMNVANQTGGLVVGTGDLSELALGWATYNGDHISMYAVNVSIPKTLVRYLVAYVAQTEGTTTARETLLDILQTPVSPELLPAENGKITQKTEDLVGPYELHDFFLYYMLRFGFRPAKIFFLAEKAFAVRQGSPTAEKYDKATIKHWLSTFYRRFFAQQFKRSCLPDGPKVGSVCLSPRGDWRMPSDACATAWLREVEEM
ncbi:MAG: NAD(+) synthase [Prevotellaceae bacterium]|jgi:NAD+ synthase (glutamine-hydrolysing)|nr:NAD(+) synthase [Prevotellaceae bacterium]